MNVLIIEKICLLAQKRMQRYVIGFQNTSPCQKNIQAKKDNLLKNSQNFAQDFSTLRLQAGLGGD
jgi:hypothetical protein